MAGGGAIIVRAHLDALAGSLLLASAAFATDLDPPFDRVYPLVAPKAPLLGHEGILTGAAVVARRPCARGPA